MRRLEPLFKGLQYYSQSIEVVCNGTPFLPWIWAPIKLILKVASDQIEAFEKLIQAYARIAEPLARLKIISQAFLANHEIQKVLAIFYADICKFHKEAYKFVRRSGWKVLFMTSWGRFERRFNGIIEDLKAHEALIDKTASAVGLSEVKKLREALELQRQESLEEMAEKDTENTAKQYQAIVGWLKMDDHEQLKIFDLVITEAQRYDGTCDWILKQNKIAAWMKCSQELAFLVLRGNVGTGKSVLAAHITNFLRASKQSLVVCHICTYAQAASTEYGQILRSILLRLVQASSDLIAYIYKQFIQEKKSPSVQALESLILSVIGAISDNPSQTSYIHIILDGLDECEEKTQLKIITHLERMVSSALRANSTICKVLVTTNMQNETPKKLKAKQQVSLTNEKTALSKAISVYTASKLSEHRSRWFQMGITDTDLKELELRLAEKADGTLCGVIEYKKIQYTDGN
ncbi:hypothetical protein JDV02_009797 [Purpureocillium takamizusanense]|uniref:NACHT domain-containing protein n=1 Tax=Purpureocillium takamizusanense TaxID=2060973 RepID=A0A9Q8VGQ2_9HYPO|nr:uncharacterized protein JDV02_009797 [Purpureocillium takamizusanense]UNI24017.1 hypothetical protein JDV02_009797 [Purpureocillium takamizusanense]